MQQALSWARTIRGTVTEVNCRRRRFSSSSPHDGETPVEQQVQRMRDRFQEMLPSSHQGNFWENLWQEGITPWDLGRPTPVLRSELASWNPQECDNSTPFRALIPGCGAGYDLNTIAQWIDGPETMDSHNVVVGLDLSETSLQRASAIMKNSVSSLRRTRVELARGDFFEKNSWKSVASFGVDSVTNTVENQKQERFDFIFDYTFFCALPPSLRSDWGKQMASLLTPKTGRLLTIVFPVVPTGGALEGPPFPVTVEDYQQVLEPHGLILEGPPGPHPDTVPSRVGMELVGWWKWKDEGTV